MKSNIALVSSSQLIHANSKYLNIEQVKEIPKKYELVLNKYDAVVIDKGNGKFHIETIKSENFKKSLEETLSGKKLSIYSESEKRGNASNILGFLLMFILIEGIMLMRLFAEDRDDKIFERIMYSPISILSYVSAYLIFNFVLIYIPVMAILILEKVILKVDIGFSLSVYAYLLALISILSTGFGIFMNSIVDNYDNCSSLSCSIIVLTSILAGSFYSFKNDNYIFKALINILPQKQYITLVHGIEQGTSIVSQLFSLTYILLSALMFILIGSIVIMHHQRNN
jgi:ABC-2 type transport system permease protein